MIGCHSKDHSVAGLRTERKQDTVRRLQLQTYFQGLGKDELTEAVRKDWFGTCLGVKASGFAARLDARWEEKGGGKNDFRFLHKQLEY